MLGHLSIWVLSWICSLAPRWFYGIETGLYTMVVDVTLVYEDPKTPSHPNHPIRTLVYIFFPNIGLAEHKSPVETKEYLTI